jgi:hypothetical protein
LSLIRHILWVYHFILGSAISRRIKDRLVLLLNILWLILKRTATQWLRHHLSASQWLCLYSFSLIHHGACAFASTSVNSFTSIQIKFISMLAVHLVVHPLLSIGILRRLIRGSTIVILQLLSGHGCYIRYFWKRRFGFLLLINDY